MMEDVMKIPQILLDDQLEELNRNLPEWARIPLSVSLSGVSRSLLYENFDTNGGPIRTATIKKRGALRGIRLVHVPSLISWISSQANSPEPAKLTIKTNEEGTL